MGCGQSQIPAYSSTPVIKKQKQRSTFLLGTPEKGLIEKAVSPTGVALDDRNLLVMTSSALVVITTLPSSQSGRKNVRCVKYNHNKGGSRKAKLINISEEATERPPPKESQSFTLPQGQFIDGLLGTTYRSVTQRMLVGLSQLKNIRNVLVPVDVNRAFGIVPRHILRQKIQNSDLQTNDKRWLIKIISGNPAKDESHINDLLSDLGPGQHFTDEEFPPSKDSLFLVNEEGDEGIEWKRPQELVNDPQMYVGGANRKDVIQGTLGDCWFLSSCAAVARKQQLIERVIPPNQCLKGEDYTGAIICRFWRFGDWVTVCIDDFLPTINGQLIYARSENPNEFWIALLEKAYAKIHGSYQALGGGQSMDALVDLTGGIAERYDMEDSPDKAQLFSRISHCTRNGAFITTSRKGDWTKAFQADKYGLVEGHAYTVSGVARVDHKKKGLVPLIRMRNPWGNEAEWLGKWSDGDEMWDNVSPDMRRKLLTENKKDGEFWMSFDDFYKQFEEISLCSMGPDFDNDGKVDKAGMVLAIKGSWKPGISAGGSRNDFKKFSSNPQILLTIKEVTDDDQDDSNLSLQEERESLKGKSQVLIGLMQEHRQSVRDEAVEMLQIGFCVYKTSNPETRMDLSQFYCTYDVGNSGTYINYREVICRLELLPGYYIIIPATFDPNTPGSFMVRVYSPNAFELKALD